MIVDAHAHVFNRLSGAIGRGGTEPLPYGKVRLGNGEVIRLLPPLATETCFSIEVLLGYMDWAGVDKAVLLQGPLYGDMNGYVHAAVQRWPDRFMGVGLVDPWSVSAPGTFDYLVNELGFTAIKLELSEGSGLGGLYKDFHLTDAALGWLWDGANRLGLTVTLDLGLIRGRAYQTKELHELIETHPAAQWVIAHLAWPSPQIRSSPEVEVAWVEQILLAKYPNVWMDLAALPSQFADEDYPFPSVADFVGRAVDLVGAKKLLWGTDVPGMLTMLTYHQMRDMFMRHCHYLSPTDKELIFGANALAAYGHAA